MFNKHTFIKHNSQSFVITLGYVKRENFKQKKEVTKKLKMRKIKTFNCFYVVNEEEREQLKWMFMYKWREILTRIEKFKACNKLESETAYL